MTFYHGVYKMARTKMLQIRLNENELAILEQYAKQQNISMSEVIRDYVKSLKSTVEQSSDQINLDRSSRPKSS